MGFENFSTYTPPLESEKDVPKNASGLKQVDTTELSGMSNLSEKPLEATLPKEHALEQSGISEEGVVKRIEQEEQGIEIPDTKKQEFLREDRENITRALGTFSDHLEEFSSTLRRGRFPKTLLETEGMRLGGDAEINPIDLSQRIEALRKSISRIKFMEDDGTVSVDARLLRTVGDEIETLVFDGLKLRRTFENARSVNLDTTAKDVGRLIYSLKEKKDQADDLMRLALRYNQR